MLVKGDITNTRIAISGGLCSGKTQAAGYLRGQRQFQLLGFATPLYELCDAHGREPQHRFVRLWVKKYLIPFGVSNANQDHFEDMVLEAFSQFDTVKGKNRPLLQHVGTEVGREFDSELWVKLFEKSLDELGPNARVVNDNVRFPNEIDSCERMGFVKVYLDVDPEVQANRYQKVYGKDINEYQGHASESHLAEARERADFIFNNSFSMTSPLYAFLEETVLYA